MTSDPLFLSRIQFAYTVSFHILFPTITIGLSVWLAVLQGLALATGKPLYERLFAFWLKIFAILFAMGVVSGIVMAFQFGTNWSVLSARAGPVLGPLIGYETLTAFMLEAAFLGIVLYARQRVPAWFYFLSCLLVALGTTLSSFWILCNNSWMQVPVGAEIIAGRIVPTDWKAIVLGPVFLIRWLHMLLATFLTATLCIAALGAWYVLGARHLPEARLMLRWGLVATAVLIVPQIVIGDLSGKQVYRFQPAKFAAIEARWHREEPGRLVWVGIPDEANRRNRFAIASPYLGSWLATGSWTAPVEGLSDFPERDWPPVLLSFLTFRAMFGLGVLMLILPWWGLVLARRVRLESARGYLRALALAFPAGFLAVILGWATAEVGRQPWAVYGLIRTADAVTPGLTAGGVMLTLVGYLAVHTLIFLCGGRYLARIISRGPSASAGGIG